MAIKVNKCRILSLHRGQITENSVITLDGVQVPSVASVPFKFLGMPISTIIDAHDHRKDILDQLKDLLLNMNKSLVSAVQSGNMFSYFILLFVISSASVMD